MKRSQVQTLFTFIFFAAAIALLFRSRFAIEVDGVGEVGVEVEGGVETLRRPASSALPKGAVQSKDR